MPRPFPQGLAPEVRVVWRCGFELHFPDRDDTEHLSVCLSAIGMSPFEKCQVLCPFLNWIFLFFSGVGALHL